MEWIAVLAFALFGVLMFVWTEGGDVPPKVDCPSDDDDYPRP